MCRPRAISGRSACEILDLLAQQEAGDRGIVVDDDAAFAVEDLAARREHGNLADAVGLGQHAVVLGAEDLQTPQPGGEHGEHQHDDVLRRVQLDRRDLLVAAVVPFGIGDRCAWLGDLLRLVLLSSSIV